VFLLYPLGHKAKKEMNFFLKENGENGKTLCFLASWGIKKNKWGRNGENRNKE
jgi:hypothetical protein